MHEMNGHTEKSVEDLDVPVKNGGVVDVDLNSITDEGVPPPIGIEPASKSVFEQFLKKKSEKKPTEAVSLRSLMRYAQPLDMFCMVVGTLGALAHGAALPLLILVFGNLLNSFTSRANTLCSYNFTSLAQQYCPPGFELDSVNFYASMSTCNFTAMNLTNMSSNLQDEVNQQTYYLVSIGCAVILLGYFQIAFWSVSAERQTRVIRQTLFRAILYKEITYFDTHKTGELNTRLTDDINAIHDGIGDKIGTASQFIVSFITGFVIGFAKGWKLTLVVLSLSPLMFASAIVFSKLFTSLTALELKAYGKAGAVAEEVFSSIRTVFAYNGQEREKERYGKYLLDAKASGIRKGMITGVTMGIIWLVIYCAYALGFWYGAKLLRAGEYQVGNIFTVFFVILIAVFNLGQAGPHFQALTQARVAAYAVWQIIDAPSNIISDSKEGMKKDHLIGDIQFSGVRFHYPSRPAAEVLNGLSFDVKRGQTIALVGSSGSGKSTCVQLLQRFYDPDSGSVIIDNNPVNEYNLRWLRQQIGVVSQEPVLFHATIRENILLGRETATDEEIHEAAKMANAHDFIMTLPDKYNTRVGERGAALSGGQKQRIAIARALIRDPRILLLDEATSALDNESEKIVQDALDRAAEGRTTLVIAHRLSTIRNADKIVVMDKGAVVEEGNHDELMRARGIYFGLVEKQNLRKAEEEEQAKFEQQEDTEIILAVQKDERQLGLGRSRASTMISLSPSIMAAIQGIKTKSDDNDDEESKNNEEKKKKSSNVAWTMMKMNKPEWLFIVFGCLGCICSGGVQPAFGIIMSKLIAVFQICDKNEQARRVLLYILLFIAFGIVNLFAMFLQNYMFSYSGEALTKRLRTKAFHALLRQDVAYFDQPQNSTGALCTRLATEASAVRGATGIRIGMVCQNISSLGVGVIISFVFSWQLTLVILGFLPFMVLGGFLQSRLMTGFASKDKKALEDAGKISVESIQNIRTVIQLTKEDYFCQEYGRLLTIPYRSSMRRAHVMGVLFALTDSVMYFCLTALFSLGAYLVQQNIITFQDILLVFNCIIYGAQSVGQTASMAPDYGKAIDAAEQILALLARKPLIDNGSNEGEEISNFSGQLEFDGVHFIYPTRPEAIILRNFKLKIQAGKKVALVGASGCGKSTTIQLIERFYDAPVGCLLADNKDIRSLNIQWYRSQFGIVSQEPVLFDMSIRENIAYGDTSRNNIPMEEIIQAAKDANIHAFIQQLPDGYDTDCGAKGTQLSGGQKQRIAIARALIRNPKILLLDEATSALDSESEKIVQDALDRAQQNRTSITIAHRLSTIQNSDVICVVHNGIVVETGTHEELLALGGRYYRLVQGKLQ